METEEGMSFGRDCKQANLVERKKAGELSRDYIMKSFKCQMEDFIFKPGDNRKLIK